MHHIGPQTLYKIKVNNCTSIDLEIRIELSRAILMPRFSNSLRNSNIHFRMFLYLVTYSLRVTVPLLCRLQDVSKIQVPIYPYLISEGRRNCSTLWPCTMDDRISQKFKNSIKIARVNSILSPNLSIYSYLLSFCPFWSKATFHALSIYREVYGLL